MQNVQVNFLNAVFFMSITVVVNRIFWKWDLCILVSRQLIKLTTFF